MRSIVALAVFAGLVVLAVSTPLEPNEEYNYDEYEDENPFEMCRTHCEMPSSSAQWIEGEKSRHPTVIRRRQRQAQCADNCICKTYCETLHEAGIPIQVKECDSQCMAKKPFSGQPQDWKIFFGEDELYDF